MRHRFMDSVRTPIFGLILSASAASTPALGATQAISDGSRIVGALTSKQDTKYYTLKGTKNATDHSSLISHTNAGSLEASFTVIDPSSKRIYRTWSTPLASETFKPEPPEPELPPEFRLPT